MVQVEAHLVQDCIVPGFVYGVGPTMIGLNAMLSEISRTNIPVLLVGESGTGKDAYARLIHRLPQESDRNFFRINCAATDPADLLAQLQKVMSGKAHSESSRTIYLDNIQELDSACQRVLTSQLPEQEIIVSTDAIVPRFISSSTRNLEAEVETARFRRDLYFRLNGACLRLPPLL